MPKVTLSCRVTNLGAVAGIETVQAYVRPPGGQRRLAGFARAAVDAGAGQAVQLTLEPRTYASWDVGEHRWVWPDGRFEVVLGADAVTPLCESHFDWFAG